MTGPGRTITLAFLGDRDYVQGATLLESLADVCRNGTDIRFKVPRLITSDRLGVVPFDPEIGPGDTMEATLTWSAGGRRKAVGIRSLAPSPQPRREPFDEGLVIGDAVFSGNMATLAGRSPYSFVRTLVSLNKALLLRLLSPPEPGQWLFTRLDIASWYDRPTTLSLRFSANLRFQAVSSEIAVDGEKVGSVLFSWLTR